MKRKILATLDIKILEVQLERECSIQYRIKISRTTVVDLSGQMRLIGFWARGRIAEFRFREYKRVMKSRKSILYNIVDALIKLRKFPFLSYIFHKNPTRI